MYDKLIGHFIGKFFWDCVQNCIGRIPLNLSFLRCSAEPQCIQPTFLTDHPLLLSPLAKEREDKPGKVFY